MFDAPMAEAAGPLEGIRKICIIKRLWWELKFDND